MAKANAKKHPWSHKAGEIRIGGVIRGLRRARKIRKYVPLANLLATVKKLAVASKAK